MYVLERLKNVAIKTNLELSILLISISELQSWYECLRSNTYKVDYGLLKILISFDLSAAISQYM